MSNIDPASRIRGQITQWNLDYTVSMFDTDSSNMPQLFIPDTQRQWAWTRDKTKRQEKLIDSIMHNYPIPGFIVNQTPDGRYAIYDGRHRIETAWRYKHNEFKWKGHTYDELIDSDKRVFDEHVITVHLMRNATPEQLADAFIRVNAGSPLKDYDLFWANRNSNLVKEALLVGSNEDLKYLWGEINLSDRKKIHILVGLVFGLSTGTPGNFTTSYIRAAPFLNDAVDTDKVNEGISALLELYHRANMEFPMNAKFLQEYHKLGYINAYFLSDWMNSEDKEATIEKWKNIIGQTRDETTKNAMKAALSTSGAQNLNHRKITEVLEKVNRYLNTGDAPEEEGSDEESV